MLPVVIAAAAVVLLVAGLYLMPRLSPPDATALSVVATAPVAAVQAAAQPDRSDLDRDDLRRHLELTEQELVRSTEDLVRAERAWTTVSTRLTRNFLLDERRRAYAGTDASRDARQNIERALDELHTVMTSLK